MLKNNLLQLATIQTFYDYLSQDIKDSSLGLKIGELSGRSGRLQPGKPAPSFELSDLQNKKYNLSLLKGKKILLHFWSSTCAPCIKEAPDLIKLDQFYKNSLTTINVSLDTDKEKWLKGVEKAGIDQMNNVCDLKGFQGAVATDYAINVIPAYYLIDEEGKIILKGSLGPVLKELKKTATRK